MNEPEPCDADHVGYDGMFGLYCDLPAGHPGPHWDGSVIWAYSDTPENIHKTFA